MLHFKGYHVFLEQVASGDVAEALQLFPLLDETGRHPPIDLLQPVWGRSARGRRPSFSAIMLLVIFRRRV